MPECLPQYQEFYFLKLINPRCARPSVNIELLNGEMVVPGSTCFSMGWSNVGASHLLPGQTSQRNRPPLLDVPMYISTVPNIQWPSTNALPPLYYRLPATATNPSPSIWPQSTSSKTMGHAHNHGHAHSHSLAKAE